MRCLRCPEVELVEQQGALDEAVCPSCQGRLLDATASARVLQEYCGLERGLLGELCDHYRGRLRCPACDRHLSSVPVVGVAVELCGGCGALFLDAGELGRLTRGDVAEIRVGAPALVEDPAQAPGPVPSSSSSSSSSAAAAAGRDAVVFLRDPLGHDDAPGLLDDVWRQAGFRTGVDARAMAARAAGGVFADDCSEEDARRLQALLEERGREAFVVAWADVSPPPAFRQKELRIDGQTLTVLDGLGRPDRTLAIGSLTALAAATSRVLVTEATGPSSEDRGRSSRSSLSPTIAVLTARPGERSERQPTTVTVERSRLFLDVVAGSWRLRLDEAGFVARPNGPRSLQDLARRLDELAPASTARHRGFMALVQGSSPPALRTPRELDREVAWCLWRRSLG